MKITNNQSQFVSHKLVVTKKKKSCVCMWREKESGRKEREREEYFLLDNLYYFIELYVKIRSRMFGELWNKLVK